MSRSHAWMARAILSIGFACALQLPALHAQKKGQPSIGGSWTLNADLSDPPPRQGAAGGDASTGNTGYGDDDGRGRGMRGGMGMGGGGMGMGGGMGRGGMGGGGRGNGGGAPDPAARQAMMALMRPAKQLLIVHEESMITFRDDEGNTHSIVPDGQPVKEYFDTGDATTVAKWRDGRLEVKRETENGPTVQQSYSIEDRTGAMIVVTKIDGGRMGRSVEIHRVYDRATPAK